MHTLCNTLCMTTMQGGHQRVPEWDMTDRLNKALKESGLSVTAAARYFDVHRNTVSGWLHGRINPDTRTLKLWAFMTGVPYEWIKDGKEPPPPNGDGGSSLLPRLDSNQQPSDCIPLKPLPAAWDRAPTRHAA